MCIKEEPMVLSHNDLCPWNIIVDNDHDLNIKGVIDWEYAGFYPKSYEYHRESLLHNLFECSDIMKLLEDIAINVYANKDEALSQIIRNMHQNMCCVFGQQQKIVS